METLKIECSNIGNINSLYSDTDIRVTLECVDTDFIAQLSVEDICINVSDRAELFNEIMTFDDGEEVLHKYLEESGYIFNKE